MPNQQQIREQITSQIVEAIEKGCMPWRRPWRQCGGRNVGRPTSLATGKPYQGVNPLLLQLHADQFGFRSKWWGTYDQWRRWGGQVKARPDDVKPGHWAARVVLFQTFSTTEIDQDTGEERDEQHYTLRYFFLFNADQVENVEPLQSRPPEGQQQTEPDFGPAEHLLQSSGADIRHDGDRAYYRRPTPEGSFPHHKDGDFIVLPHKARFESMGAYYETALHELAHWSEIRTGWDSVKQGYALGELAAEISSCYLSQDLGVPQGEGLENHAAYLASWLREMKGDPSYIFKASRQASKVTDYLLAFTKQPEVQSVGMDAERTPS